ncbi:hypothetical protein SAMN03159488_02783 [Pseudomonas sp. NFIX10]|uniref:hypothetical protein n=1 Tax=unclassified Pseudomonas TaxID=196821 RepID=UPI0008EC22D8|nr:MULTISPECIES: hypothetical protein [unclassified Pseudomonas]SFB28535.1 hypothetical protein SAMN03159488_02783 [Pseudomonas sp. NFIX10]SFE88698.1 hypothetical protein SAMN03159367_02354 [Pseudomonas sp. NFACC06-1]
MLNEIDTVGHTFKRAFFRVDGVTMYFFWAIWAGFLIWALSDPAKPGAEALALFMIGMLNPFLYIFLGVMRSPGLLTALVLIFLNVRFLWAFI